MDLRRPLFFAILIVCLLALYLAANRVMIAAAISQPDAAFGDVLRSATHTEIQIAAPHRTLFKEFRLRVVPRAHAQFQPECDCQEAKPSCVNSCGFCGKCPDCWNGPCTPYVCQSTGNTRRTCIPRSGTGQCAMCQNDVTSSNCTPPPNCPGGICP
jgi:hypothetical protein